MSAAPGLLRQELSCPLCLQLFDAPVTAECGHSFCRACLSRVAGEPGADGTAPCPSCQAPTRPQALSTNLQLARLVEGLAQVPQGHCEEHLDPLSIYCEQDRALVCGVCASLGSHRGHRLLPAAEAHARLKLQLELLELVRRQVLQRVQDGVALLPHGSAAPSDGASGPAELDVRVWTGRLEFGRWRKELELARSRAGGRALREARTFHLSKLKIQQRALLLALPRPMPPPKVPSQTLPIPPRLQKILAESPPPARLDIQLPVISDDFKFQVWRKMFRALMP
uniref:Uncharacterized protein n=1 Tax=Myotis lucifugus TaxID=59463 RepID=G1PYR0_MYOLU